MLPPLDSPEALSRRRQILPRIPPTTLDALGIGFDVPVRDALRDARHLGKSTWLATCAGEFGGGLLELTKGKLKVRHRGCFLALRQVGEEIWAFEGSQHLEEGYGRIWRIDRRYLGSLAPVADLPGEPQAVRVASSEALVATNRGDVAVGPDGSLSPLDCEPL